MQLKHESGIMRRMVVDEAEWYGAEAGTQDAMNGANPIAGPWATVADFDSEKAYTAFVDNYYKAYRETRAMMEGLDEQDNLS